MGVDRNLYTGPFLRVVGKVKAEAKESITSCSNFACKEHGEWAKGNFCRVCGAAIQVVNIIKQKDYGAREILDKAGFEDSLCYTDPMCGHHDTYIPNNCDFNLAP